MSQTEKAAYYKALKNAGVEFDRHYRDYSTEELQNAYNRLMAEQGTNPPPPTQPAAPTPPQRQAGYTAKAPVAPRDPNEFAGQRLNTQLEDIPIRVDERGREWFQEEVLKPAFPKPRGRRVLDYVETGTKIVEAQNGEYRESFEVAGDDPGRTAQVKITLPSYQVGIYKDPRFPFRVITYNGNEGFDLAEVQKYYGGAELVPSDIKRKYVENVLCYDIRTVIRAIQTEFRQLQLQGKV